MARYIDAEALMDDLLLYAEANEGTYHAEGFKNAITVVEDQPTVDVVEIKKDGEWEMLDLISSAYYGKEMYFKEDNLTVYSRYSHHYMSVDDAIREFISLIG